MKSGRKKIKYKIGVFGSADGDFEKILKKAHILGEELGRKAVIVITGAATGLPHEVAAKAHEHGAEVWGYSAGVDIAEQRELTKGYDTSIYDKLFFTPRTFEFSNVVDVSRKYRNVTSTANSEAGIIISGRWGTMNEFTNLFDMGKIIGVLTGTGGIADELENLMKKISKKSKAKVVFSSSAKDLVNGIINLLDERTNNTVVV